MSTNPAPPRAAAPRPRRLSEAQLFRRILPFLHRFFAVPDAYPTINSPRSGDVFDGGQVVPVELSTNKDVTHELRLIPVGGAGTSQNVNFNGNSSVTVNQAMPPASGNQDDYFLEVQAPSGGPAHRIVVSVRPAMGATVTDDAGANPTHGTPYTITVDITGGVPDYVVTWSFSRTGSARKDLFITQGPSPHSVNKTFPVADTYALELILTDDNPSSDPVRFPDIKSWVVS